MPNAVFKLRRDVNLAGCHHSTTTLLCGAAPLSPGVREVNDRFDDTVVIILLAKQPRQVTLKVQSSLFPSFPLALASSH